MDITCAIAMTRAEFTAVPILPKYMAWMACHFSASGDGLSNLPERLPADSLIIIDDSFPPDKHDPERILAQLKPLHSQAVLGVLLDFQRPDLEENRRIANYLAKKLPCTICVTPGYAKDMDCPVLLPSPAPHQPLESHLAPWKGRQIWLEATLERERITVTREGSSVITEGFSPLTGDSITDLNLCCRYQIRIREDRAVFTLVRDRELLQALLTKATGLGVHQAVGLYQQLGNCL